jgi:hypothetical protein
MLHHKLITLCGSANIIIDLYTIFLKLSEIADKATATADHVQLHIIGIIFVLTELAKDARNVIICNVLDNGQIFLGNVCRSVSKDAFDYRKVMQIYIKKQGKKILDELKNEDDDRSDLDLDYINKLMNNK